MDSFQKRILELFEPPEPDENDPEGSNVARIGRNEAESEALGKTSLSEGDYARAIDHFKRAIEQGGSSPEALENLAGAYETADMAPQAFRQYEKAMKLRASAELETALADLYARYGRFRDSVEHLRHAAEREPNNAFVRVKLAEALRKSGYPRAARAAIQEAVALAPDESHYHYWLGDLLIELGEDQEALEALRAAIELSPGDDGLYFRVAVPFWRTGRHQEAIRAIRLASELDPNKDLYHGLLERLLIETDQPQEALLESGRAQQMDPYDRHTLQTWLREAGIL